MTKRKNEYGALKTLSMYPVFKITDPLTQVNLQIKAFVEFTPGVYLPVFTEVNNLIKQKIDTKKITIEESAEMLIDIFKEYEPQKIWVKVEVINNNTFFPVVAVSEIDCVFEEDPSIKKKDSVKKNSSKKKNETKEEITDEDEDEDNEETDENEETDDE